MALRRVSAIDVVRYFSGGNIILSEVFMKGSDDDLGMKDVYSESSDEESNSDKPSHAESDSK